MSTGPKPKRTMPKKAKGWRRHCRKAKAAFRVDNYTVWRIKCDNT